MEACLAKLGSIWPRHTWASYCTQGTPLIYSTDIKHRVEGSPLMWVTGGKKASIALTESLGHCSVNTESLEVPCCTPKGISLGLV